MRALRAIPYLIFLAPCWSAQDNSALQIPVAMLSENGGLLSVGFSQPVSRPGPQTDKTLVRLVNAPHSRITAADRSALESTVVSLKIDPPIEDATGVRVCFPQVKYPDPKDPKKELTTNSEICADVKKGAKEARDTALKELKSVPKNSNEKNIFASGFVTTASGGSAGGADISLNPNLGIDGLTSFLNIKKTTQQGGDPKHFEGGTRYQAVLPLGRGLINQMQAANTVSEMGKLLNQQQQKFLAGAVYDMAAKLEGEPAHFNVTNFVGDTGLSLRSMTKGFAAKKGFWRGFVLPVAFEGGRALGTGQVSNSAAGTTAPANTGSSASRNTMPDWIARYKAGLGMTLFYNNWESQFPIRRVELDMNGVVRNLFFQETMYNSKTKMNDVTGKGFRAYGQVDLKLFVGQDTKGRYGLKLSYNRGSLPPIFARVKSFQFGFLYETTDDTTAKK